MMSKGRPRRAARSRTHSAVSLVRGKAKELGIDPKRIGIVGFSAGGHLAIATATSFDKRSYEPIDDIDKVSCRPDFAVPVYSGYLKSETKDELADGLRVPVDTPTVFLAHGAPIRSARPSTASSCILPCIAPASRLSCTSTPAPCTASASGPLAIPAGRGPVPARLDARSGVSQGEHPLSRYRHPGKIDVSSELNMATINFNGQAYALHPTYTQSYQRKSNFLSLGMFRHA